MDRGDFVTPNLRLVSVLGQGGMGSVWVADHLGLGTQVAIKFMGLAFANHPQFVERFRREAMAAAQLKNPHVAQVLDNGVAASGEPYIVMELLEGEDLGAKIRREGALSALLVGELLTQAAKALGKAHQLGIVHRDIKPANLFITELDGEPFLKVLDFGIAKMSGDANMAVTSTAGTFGSPLYMSPEQLLSAKHVGPSTDIWSLGVVAYHALTGALPFPGDTIGAVSVAVHTGVFTPPSQVRAGIPGALDAWFSRVFRRDPGERFASAKEAAEAFRQAATARETSMPVLAPEPATMPMQKVPVAPPPDLPPTAAPGAATFGGTAVTGATSQKKAGKWAGIAALVLLAVAAALLFVRKPWSGDNKTPSAAVSGDPTSQGATASITDVLLGPGPTASASTAPSDTTTGSRSASEAPTTSAAQTASTGAGGPPTKGTAPPPPKPPVGKTTPSKSPKPPGTPDDVGF